TMSSLASQIFARRAARATACLEVAEPSVPTRMELYMVRSFNGRGFGLWGDRALPGKDEMGPDTTSAVTFGRFRIHGIGRVDAARCAPRCDGGAGEARPPRRRVAGGRRRDRRRGRVVPPHRRRGALRAGRSR